MRRSLRSQITVTIMMIVLFTVAVVSLLSNMLIQRKFEDYITEHQQLKTADLVTLIENRYDPLTGRWDLDFIHGVGMSALTDGYIIRLSDKNGERVWDAENHDMSLCNRIMAEITTRMEKNRPRIKGGFQTTEYQLKLSNDSIGTLQISYYGPFFLNESEFQFLHYLNLVLISVGGAALLMSFAAGVILARWIARPIVKTAYISKQISAGNYGIRFEGKTITRELNELAAAVNHLAEALEAQESLREHLTEDVAHELRTPLTTTASHLEAMIEGVWEPTPERLQSCYDEIGRLTGLVEQLEQLARVEGANLELVKGPVDLLELAESAAANFAIEAAKKDIKLVVQGQSCIVSADRNRLSQVAANLLANALHYTDNGGRITIAVREGQQWGELSVADNGIGIPRAKLPFIFERFYRTDQSRSRRTGGAGIGLTIVKSIVAAHGGTVAAASEVNEGSCFCVKLPK